MELKDRKYINNLPKYREGKTSLLYGINSVIKNNPYYDDLNKLINPSKTPTIAEFDANKFEYQPMQQFTPTNNLVQDYPKPQYRAPLAPEMKISMDQVKPIRFAKDPAIGAPSTAELDGLKSKVDATTPKVTPKKSVNWGAMGEKAMGVTQAALGVWQLGNTWSENSKARINPEELVMQAGTSTVDVGGGISYERVRDIDGNSALEQAKSEANRGALNAAATGASTGAALASVIPGVGTAVGAVVGGLIGGIGGLFSKSSRMKEERERMRRAMLIGNSLRESARTWAFTQKARKEENEKYGDQDDQLLYAFKEGKDEVDPVTNQTYKNFIVDTAFGKQYMPQNAWGSKGEWIESGATGDLHQITHGKNDTARIHVDDNDTIYSAQLNNPITGNKIADDVPTYAAAGNLDELKMIQRNQRNSKKLRSFAKGAEWLTNLIPAVSGSLIGWNQYKDAAGQDVYKPNSFQSNLYVGALNDLDKLHIDQFPILQQMRAAEARNINALFRSGGLTTGQRATNLIAAQHQTQDAIANALASHQQMNNQYRAQAAKARLDVGAQEAQRRQQAYQWDADTYAKGHAARQQGMQMGLYNMQNALEQYIANEFKRNQFNKTMRLYEDDQKINRDRLDFEMGVRTKDPIYYNYFRPYNTFSNITDNSLVSNLQQKEDLKRIAKDNAQLAALQSEEEKALLEAAKTFRRKPKRRRN